MAQQLDTQEILDQFLTPAFSVRRGCIFQVNYAAQRCMIAPGTQISSLLETDPQAYAQFTGGCLYLTLTVGNRDYGAAVTRHKGFDLFVMDHDIEQEQLRALALASRELRAPLADIISATDRLLAQIEKTDSTKSDAATINRSIYQLHRLVCNMSDAARYECDPQANQSLVDMTAVFDEVLGKAGVLAAQTGVTLRYCSAGTPVWSLADEEKIRRAIYNLISNSLKFTPKGGVIDAKLALHGSRLALTVQDSGRGIPPELRSSVFSRYRRNASLEDGLYGIGLGLVIVRAVAAAHGGTVLLEQPEGQGARFTVTFSVRKSAMPTLRASTVTSDYTGGRDMGLLELSDVLPASAYEV